MKICTKCGTPKPEEDFGVNRAHSTGKMVRCRVCVHRHYVSTESRHRETGPGRRRRPLSREEKASIRKKWKKRHPEKLAAQRAVQYAVRTGKLVRGPCYHGPAGCSGTITGHHHSYEPEYQLDVIWLCYRHHMDEHFRLREAKIDPDSSYKKT